MSDGRSVDVEAVPGGDTHLLRVEDGVAYPADRDWASAGPGPIETDEWDPGSTSNVEF